MKKIISLIIAVILLCSSTAFAADNLIISVEAFTGALYICDTPTERVVVTGITPVAQTQSGIQTAKEAEYLEISICADAIFSTDGLRLPIEYLNDYVDSEVWFLLAKTADGSLTIPYFTFK